MLNIQISTASGAKHILTTDKPLNVQELCDRIKELTVSTRINASNLKILHSIRD